MNALEWSKRTDFKSFPELIEAARTDACAELLERLEKAEMQLKEAEWLIENACDNHSVVWRWWKRRYAFLAARKDAK